MGGRISGPRRNKLETPFPQAPAATIERAMADQTPAVPPLDQQLQEIGAQLAWVRDYL
jgi:hypothetical protein